MKLLRILACALVSLASCTASNAAIVYWNYSFLGYYDGDAESFPTAQGFDVSGQFEADIALDRSISNIRNAVVDGPLGITPAQGFSFNTNVLVDDHFHASGATSYPIDLENFNWDYSFDLNTDQGTIWFVSGNKWSGPKTGHFIEVVYVPELGPGLAITALTLSGFVVMRRRYRVNE